MPCPSGQEQPVVQTVVVKEDESTEPAVLSHEINSLFCCPLTLRCGKKKGNGVTVVAVGDVVYQV